jgi:regulator of sigma E protease
MPVIASIVSLAGYMLPFLFVLSLVIFFHELGHFLIGRWCGVKVETFSLGFGPELFGFNDRYGTRWRVATLPLGGYVRFYGDPSNASLQEKAAMAALSPQERKLCYSAQKIWKKSCNSCRRPDRQFCARYSYLQRRILPPRPRYPSACRRKCCRR